MIAMRAICEHMGGLCATYGPEKIENFPPMESFGDLCSFRMLSILEFYLTMRGFGLIPPSQSFDL